MATGCEAIVGLSLYKRTHIGYTQCVDTDVYVDDVDDDGARAGAYFFCSDTFGKWMDHS